MDNVYRIVESVIDDAFSELNEGIDFDEESKTVSFNPSHEENVDTSIENNPTNDTDLVKDIDVRSIFKRKKGKRGDGNPLVYALKGEKGWRFKDEKDRYAIEKQFNMIATKFVEEHPFDITIIIPSTNRLNEHIADVIKSKKENTEIIKGAIVKITTEMVEDIVLDFDSSFRKAYKNDFAEKKHELDKYLDRMDIEKGGYFARHLVPNQDMRRVLDRTFAASDDPYMDYAKKIRGKDVLLIDDTISQGQSVKEACKIILENYSPKSITVLTLLSKLY